MKSTSKAFITLLKSKVRWPRGWFAPVRDQTTCSVHEISASRMKLTDHRKAGCEKLRKNLKYI